MWSNPCTHLDMFMYFYVEYVEQVLFCNICFELFLCTFNKVEFKNQCWVVFQFDNYPLILVLKIDWNCLGSNATHKWNQEFGYLEKY